MHNASTPGSRYRRMMSRGTLLLCCYLFVDTFILPSAGNTDNFSLVMALAASTWSVLFFGIIVTWIIFLASENYPPDPVRLIFDVLISATLAIFSFALIYRHFGITDTADTDYIANNIDHFYFSTVTFSTLGFGDFRPNPPSRIIASIQAIFGNLHLGLLAGAAFYAVQFRKP